MTIIQYFADNCANFFNTSLSQFLHQDLPLGQLVREMEIFLRTIGPTMLQALLEQADDALYKTIKPTHRYHVKDKRPRTVTTIFGDVTYTRRYYQDTTDGSYHYLLDEWEDAPKYARIDAYSLSKVVAKAADVSYRKAAETVLDGQVSGQSVLNAIRKVGTISNEAAPLPEPKTGVKQLYIEADEDHVSMQKGHARQMKLINVYEDKVGVCKGRRKLTGKRVFTGFESPSTLWPAVNRYIAACYGEKDMPQVMIKGDGAAWIQSGADYVFQSHCVIDGYHASQYIRKIAGKGKSTLLYDAIRDDDQETFCKEVQRKLKASPKREKSIKDGYTYVMNHWAGIHEALTDRTAASSTEGQVSHTLSDRMSSRGMGWSSLGAQQMARLRTYAANGGNIQQYALEQLGRGQAAVEIPQVDAGVLTQQIHRHLQPYCNYDAEHAHRMPGSESSLYGGWMRVIEKGGFHHIM